MVEVKRTFIDLRCRNAARTTVSVAQDRIDAIRKNVDPMAPDDVSDAELVIYMAACLEAAKSLNDAMWAETHRQHARADVASSYGEEIYKRYREIIRRSVPADVKAELLARAEHACNSCGSKHDLQVDHIVPYSRGGGTHRENLQVLCAKCNASKGAKDWNEWLEGGGAITRGGES